MTMKSFVLAMAMSALAWAAAFGDEPAAVERDPSAAALENLLNSRASGSPLLYAKAAETVAEDARGRYYLLGGINEMYAGTPLPSRAPFRSSTLPLMVQP